MIFAPAAFAWVITRFTESGTQERMLKVRFGFSQPTQAVPFSIETAAKPFEPREYKPDPVSFLSAGHVE